jgi:hypothetical protein
MGTGPNLAPFPFQMPETKMTRRKLLQLGAAGAAGAAILRPTKAQANEAGTVDATIRRGAVPFLMGDTASSVHIFPWGQYEGGLVRTASVDGARGSMNRLNLVSAGPNYGVRADWVPGSPIKVSDTDSIEFWAYLASPTVWANNDPTTGAMGYLSFSDANFTRMISAFFNLVPGWNHIRLGKNLFFSAIGNATWNDNFDLMRIAMNPCAAGPISAFFGEFRKSGKDRPLICLIFDDGDESIRLNAVPILQSNGIPATVAVISNNLGKTLGTRTFSSMNQLKAYPAGTAFVNHTASHTQNFLNKPSTPYATIASEIATCQNAMASLPGFDRTMFCAPYGEWTDNYLLALKTSASCARELSSPAEAPATAATPAAASATPSSSPPGPSPKTTPPPISSTMWTKASPPAKA